ncbi:MAG: histidine kinase dimerization/phospho-acceptor domain-containing protein [Kiritimatiellae bacterium]|nr:histidine kinase dimerization/phospho-acceptor domain-containing protein [Kiritimatiellia bacterium]
MTFLPQSAWRYAVLIIILFAIVAVAAMTIISYLQDQITEQTSDETIRQLSIAIWALTMGCMFLAGALGLWAIRSTSEIEGRRRIGRFVDTMDYLSDGLLAIDGRGHVRGSNPAARKLAPHALSSGKTIMLLDVFTGLTEEDMHQLLDPFQPREIEKDCVYSQGMRTLRFRSQPSEGLMLILISDITTHHSREIRKRQIAQLQIIGRLAAGVAHDFNNILCAISGHATLLQRFGMDPENQKRSLTVITEETQKGVVLSRQLLELSRSGAEGRPSDNLAGNVAEAVALLRVALSQEWTVKQTIQGSPGFDGARGDQGLPAFGGAMGAQDAYPTVPLTPAQIEQVVLNLGLLVADAQSHPGTVTISLNRPGQGPLLDVGNQYAAVILVSGESTPLTEFTLPAQPVAPLADEGGVISSVVRTIVEETHGRVDQLVAAGGLCVYRVCLPHLDTRPDINPSGRLTMNQIRALVAQWRIMLAGTSQEVDLLVTKLVSIGAHVDRKADVVSILSGVERTPELDVLVMEKSIMGEDAHNLLKALRELCPRLGIVILGQDPKQTYWPETPGIICMPRIINPEHGFRHLIDAMSAAVRAAT